MARLPLLCAALAVVLPVPGHAQFWQQAPDPRGSQAATATQAAAASQVSRNLDDPRQGASIPGGDPAGEGAAPAWAGGDDAGMIQPAWAEPRRHMRPGQAEPGYLRVPWRPTAVPAIDTRFGTATVILLPPGDRVRAAHSFNPAFELTPAEDYVALRPLAAGVDGNVVIVGASGNKYNFYVRALPVDTGRITDLTVQISLPGDGIAAPAPALAPAAAPGGWAGTLGIGPGTAIEDLRILAATPEDRVIAPVKAWRSDRFIYLDFGPRAAIMTQAPVPSLIIQGVESPVDFEWTGPDNRLLVVKAIGDLALRNGQQIVCIHWAGDHTPAPGAAPAGRPGPRPSGQPLPLVPGGGHGG